ncbi:Z1 domain-containing protein [Clavibacter michiganensis]|uniref:Z1 domain-containing protein n=1 Tax=Clavibacter michiganensis TaxID=28447 RepID=UPI0009CCE272|nr:Z1 domain-containing protein [Clavibacter michiganensis]MBF4638652.1 hypothetical protein [Clavibacter michiganensis subsp. michiganensis]MDO4125100.1 Z1 domain-containing protein [Clavibacter michiganensis]MWJ07637.1 hypothetical protein [Clavibacter michiganensis subsp. michiganensis]MWJ88656.1 hypothetical protein [Clavibacter michiganensis subsp. michiganensis]OUD83674.1 Z1 domain protein [Clavibacter michiganensis subsp. michiganensis]
MSTVEPGALASAIQSAFNAMEKSGPKALLPRVNLDVEEGGHDAVDEASVVSFIVEAGVNDPARYAAHIALAQWDVAEGAAWPDGAAVGSATRRQRIYDLLKLSDAARTRVDEAFPSQALVDSVITSERWDPWYTTGRQERDFYWKAYKGVLEGKKWKPEAIAEVDASASTIVSRLVDPAAAAAYSSRGLVVGYVQSGKTANFTGMIAKSIDAGYRLVIVLTGTIELLRGQTQRRLDMELIGEENILGGHDKNDVNAVRDVDYAGSGDTDWLAGKFLRHDIDVNARRDIPSIKRLTTASGDYKALKQGLDTLDFRSAAELVDVSKPVNHPDNLFGTNVRIAVVKKNKSVLTKLLTDLKNVRTRLDEIPVLLIDDEADQASVNTKNNSKKARRADEEKDRTAINKLISNILDTMPRAQYVGYTATPFANVFVEPDDEIDIFPRDFIVRLKASADYMGGTMFHDLEPLQPDEEATAANSNEEAHVRNLLAAPGSAAEMTEIRQALDAFVLTGAIKLWRQTQNPDLKFRHHTMLVHEEVTQAAHSTLATLIRQVWAEASYRSPEAKARLRELYETDFAPVHRARGWGVKLPMAFEDLAEYIGEAVGKVMSDNNPVVVVNGSKESDYDAMDFTTKDYWRIMVGGTKLSRGFTVEGLTVTYFKRRAMAADTFMQMGRWFGYRPGYRDLVRLYIARDVTDSRGKSYDLYDAFTAMVQDEEAFRDQLDEFSEVDPVTGRPAMRPIDVPPLVFQQLPWLRPTSGNKMYNTEIAVEGSPGKTRDFPMHADRGTGAANARHFGLVTPWLDERGEAVDLLTDLARSYTARVAIVPAGEVAEVLDKFTWADGYSFKPTVAFIKRAVEVGQLDDFALIFPELSVAGEQLHDVTGRRVQILQRKRRGDRRGFSGSSARQRHAVEFIAGASKEGPTGPEANSLRREKGRGAILFTFADDVIRPDGSALSRKTSEIEGPAEAKDVATLFSIVMPTSTKSLSRVGFRAKRSDVDYGQIIDAD